MRCLLQSLRQLLQRRAQIIQHPRCTQASRRHGRQAEPIAEVIDREHHQVTDNLRTVEQFDPGQARRLGKFGSMSIVEQAVEQRRIGRHRTAALHQRQGRVLVGQQGTEPLMGIADPGQYIPTAQANPQRQGIDEPPRRPAGVQATPCRR